MPFSNQDYPTNPAGIDTAASLALARQRAYQLLSRLYLAGVTADLLPYVRALPPWPQPCHRSSLPTKPRRNITGCFATTSSPTKASFWIPPACWAAR